jgi:hypothetical protein
MLGILVPNYILETERRLDTSGMNLCVDGGHAMQGEQMERRIVCSSLLFR